jgi:hypothetical protein
MPPVSSYRSVEALQALAPAGQLTEGVLMLRAAIRSCRPARRHPVHADFLLVVLLLLLLGPAGTARAATNVSGTISSNTTWTLANSPYVMTGDVTVAAGVTLTLDPGVVVQGDSATRTLIVAGTLSAVGTAGQHISFTSTANTGPGQWNGIRFDSGAGASSLKFVDVRDGGDGGGSGANSMVEINGGNVTIEDSTFSQSANSGLGVLGGSTGAGVSATVRRSKFENNGSSGIGNGLYSFNGRVSVEDSAF